MQIVKDLKFTVTQAVEPVEKGINKFNQKLHHISQNIKHYDILSSMEVSATVSVQGERNIVIYQGIPVLKVVERVAVIRPLVVIKFMAVGGLSKISYGKWFGFITLRFIVKN